MHEQLSTVLAYWGLGAALLGAQSKRTALLTGTPYNNGPGDMSALMTYIDPRHDAAKIRWWEKATAKGSKKGVIEAVSDWRNEFMLRRTKDILEHKLPLRDREVVHVGAHPTEIRVYEAYEAFFLDALDQMTENMEDGSPESRRRVKELFDIMMACMSCMRMALIHPMLPGGREVTIQFSPSRRHLLKRQERPKRCVLCSGSSYPTQTADRFAAKKAGRVVKQEEGEDGEPMLGLDAHVRAEMDLDDDELDDEDAVDAMNNVADAKKGPLVELGPEICQAHRSDCRHFAHERCLEVHREKECTGGCPRCYDLSSRIHITDATKTMNKLLHKVYCQEITTSVNSGKGFTASAKIEEAIQWFQATVPKTEKAIILSFFKGSLDLMEGILTEELNIDCARYDGDVDKDVRTRDLRRFKTSNTCRVLLASVQSGGTGLNITEANNVCFLDRWFNPCVHDQAESRCHRIGQTKEVKIAYLDTSLTVDIVMKRVNELKEGNAGVLLADGTSLGDRWSLGYQNLSGVIGNTLKAIVMMRRSVIESNAANGKADNPLPSYNDSDFETKLAEAMMARASSRKKRIKAEENEEEKKSDVDKEDSPTTENDSEENGSPYALKRSSSTLSSSSSDDSVLDGGPTFGVKSEQRGSSTLSASPSNDSDDSILDGGPIFAVKTERRGREGVASTGKMSAACSPGTSEKGARTPSASRDASVKAETEQQRPTSSGSMSSNDSILNEIVFTSGRNKNATKHVKEETSAARSTSSSSRSPRSSGNLCNDIFELSSDEEDDEDLRAPDMDIDAAMKPGQGSLYVGSAEHQRQQALFASISETSPAGPKEGSTEKQNDIGVDFASASGDDDDDGDGDGDDKSRAKNDAKIAVKAAESSSSNENATSNAAEAVLSKSALRQGMNEAMDSGDMATAEALFQQWREAE